MEQSDAALTESEASLGTWVRSFSPLQTVLAAAVVTLSVVLLNLLLVGELSVFFDICFVTICLAAGLMVRRGEGWNVALLPPLLLVAVVLFLALLAPRTVAEADDNTLQALITGMATHSAALVGGYALFLGALVWGAQPSKRDWSPDPARSTSG